MHIAVFDQEAVAEGKANEFVDSNRVERTELSNGLLYVFYHPDIPLEELERTEIARRLRVAQENLVHQRIHRRFLDVVSFENTELEGKRTTSRDNTDTEIKNLEAQIKLYEEWTPASS